MYEDIINNVISGSMTFKQALESVAQKKVSDTHVLADLFLYKNVFIRTVTHHYTGTLVLVSSGFLVLEKASWIADDGRFADFLKNGTPKEVEPYPDMCVVSIGAIVDMCEWTHPLPREQK